MVDIEQMPLILTPSIVLEYQDVLLRPSVLAFMEQTRLGPEPSPEELARAVGGPRQPRK